MENKYEIKTIDDLFNVVTVDNVENLAEDLKSWLSICASMKAVAKVLGEEDDLQHLKFTWIDDGKHEKTVNIHFQEKGGPDGE